MQRPTKTRFGCPSAAGRACTKLVCECVRIAATAQEVQREIDLFLPPPVNEGSKAAAVLIHGAIVPASASRGRNVDDPINRRRSEVKKFRLDPRAQVDDLGRGMCRMEGR